MKSLSSSSQPSNARGPKDLYEVKRAAGDLLVDSHQAEALTVLDNLYHALTDAPDRSLLGLFTKPKNFAKSVYLWGGVGRGKTMLMDMFYEMAPVSSKRRCHFHEFMADVHNRVHAHRQKLKNGETKQADPIPPVAAQLLAEAELDKAILKEVASGNF